MFKQTDFKSFFKLAVVSFSFFLLRIFWRIFLTNFLILLPILWYEYSVPWRRNCEKICLRTFCMPFATLMIIKTTFWEISKSLLTKYRETIDRFCTNQLDKFCQITVSLLWNNSTSLQNKSYPCHINEETFLVYKISTLSRCWINIFLLKFFPTIFCANKSEKLQNQRNFYFKSFIPILYCIYCMYLNSKWIKYKYNWNQYLLRML